MTFTSLTFLLFLALVFSVYWAIPHRRFQNVLLLVASYCFYGWWDIRLCGLILFSSFVDYGVGVGLGKARSPRARRFYLSASLVCNLGLLGLFKYFNFFAESFMQLANSLGWNADPITLRLVLPVGISFYTFQTLSYTIDIFRGSLKPTPSLLDYLAYVAFFPQLVAGPIERAARLLPQFTAPRTFDYALARDGSLQILWGFFKKMAIADNLSVLVDPIYTNPGDAAGAALMMATFFFAFQIYCDFSAYSDIAIGVGRLFGFSLMQNFATPYFSQSVGEFWRRWHISLSTWFRDYVYIPLGGSRVGKVLRARNIMLTFLISGLWHGASWNFVIWGGIHGLALLPSALGLGKARPKVAVPGGERWFPSPGTLGRMLVTFVIVCLSWVFFRAETLGESLTILGRIAGSFQVPSTYLELLWRGEYRYAMGLGWIALLLVAEWSQRAHAHPLKMSRIPRPLRWALCTLLLWAMLYAGAETGGAFIYFQF